MTKPPKEADTVIEQKILHILDHFPKITPSMLQISLGSGIPTTLWHSILDELVEKGTIHRYRKMVITPTGRQQVQTVISKDPPAITDILIMDDVPVDNEVRG